MLQHKKIACYEVMLDKSETDEDYQKLRKITLG